MSAPSMPSSTVVRHGSRENTSGGGNGTWRKKPMPPCASRLTEQLGQQQQVVVVHPAEAGDARIVGRREMSVDEPVGIPPGAVEGRPLDEPVQQRPERSVGEAVVVRVDLAARQRDGAKLDLEPFDLPRCLDPAVPAHPDAAAGLHRRPQRGDEATVRQPPRVSHASDRKAIRERDHRQPGRVRGSCHQRLMPIEHAWCPSRASARPHPCSPGRLAVRSGRPSSHHDQPHVHARSTRAAVIPDGAPEP